MAATATVAAPRAASYVSPSAKEMALRARAELRAALALLKRDGWARLLTGWGLSTTGEVITSINFHQLEAGELEIAGWSLAGALRVSCRDQLGGHYAHRYLAKVCPCDVAHYNNHPHVDELDALRLIEKASRLASSDAGITEITGGSARGAVASPSPPRRRSGYR